MNGTVREWIDKAESDYEVAQLAMSAAGRPHCDAVCFHAQQCVEKLMRRRVGPVHLHAASGAAPATISGQRGRRARELSAAFAVPTAAGRACGARVSRRSVTRHGVHWSCRELRGAATRADACPGTASNMTLLEGEDGRTGSNYETKDSSVNNVNCILCGFPRGNRAIDPADALRYLLTSPNGLRCPHPQIDPRRIRAEPGMGGEFFGRGFRR